MKTYSRRKFYILTYAHCDLQNEDIMQRIRHLETSSSDLKGFHILYMIVSKEFHQDGAEHHHVYIHFDKPFHFKKSTMNLFDLKMDNRSLEDMNNFYHPNIEYIKSPKDAIKYVKKDGNYITSGTCPFKDELTTKEKNELLQSKSLQELVEEGTISLKSVPAIKRALDILRMEKQYGKEAEKPTVHYLYGKTGVGKTKTAWDEAREKYGDDIWCSLTDDKWFDGYIGQQAVILDDIRPSTWRFDQMLKLLDRYRLVVPIKGGFTRWCPREIWITAPESPDRLYRNYQTDQPYDGIDQLERRIDDLRDMNETIDSQPN